MLVKDRCVDFSLLKNSQLNGHWNTEEAISYIHNWGARHLNPGEGDNLLLSGCGLFQDFKKQAQQLHTSELKSSSERWHALDKLEEFFKGILAVSSENSGKLRLVADELLTNAFFDAPHGPEGGLPRDQEVHLPDPQRIKISYGSDTEWFGVCVTDPFGRLEHSMMAKALMRGLKVAAPREGRGGAGLGLFTIFSLVQILNIRVVKGECTEFQCLFSREKRHKKIQQMPIAYHFWSEGEEI